MEITHEHIRKEVLRQLDAALPIQLKLPVSTRSLLNFQITDLPESHSVNEIEELTNERAQLRNRNIHQLGESLPQLFRKSIYRNHTALSVQDNASFAGCRTDEQFHLPAEQPVNEQNSSSLSFESRFESGNLALASEWGNDGKSYVLALQRDINSESMTTQWFYFSAKNGSNTGLFTFHIVNYVKPYSMFAVGMKPCVYSTRKGKGWERAGFNVDYRKNSLEGGFYSLTFSYEFAEPMDQVYFAYCYPYTYSRLQRLLDSLQVKHTDKMRRRALVRTLGGNQVDLVSITNPQIPHKKTMFITARVHPGQTVSSFTCESIIIFLLSSHPQAERLREQFIIKIIPMLNPDGVINGNYRTSLCGEDLNRQWSVPSKSEHPQIYYAKKTILQGEYKRLLYIDIHAHSRKKGSFMYGCISPRSPYTGKQLPYVLSRKMTQFNYYSCNFAMPKNKEGTSRISLWRAGIEYSYTYQLSFCGPMKERRHFNIKDYQNIGIELCKTLSSYFYSRIFQLAHDEEVQRHCDEFYGDEELLRFGDKDTHGSSSELDQEAPRINPSMSTRVRKLHNATERTENDRLNQIIESYIGKRQESGKIIQAEESRQLLRDKCKGIEKEIYLKQRQSFLATRVNLNQIQTQQTPQILHPIQPYRSSSLRLQSGMFSERKSGAQSFGVLLPNVQKSQYRRYQRYPKSKPLGERSSSFYLQQMNLPGRHSFRLGREISLADRIRSRTNDRP